MTTNSTQEEFGELVGALASHGRGGLNPTEEQLRALFEADRDGPLQFVNLLRFHDRARYPEGHELDGAGLTGQTAYMKYGVVALEHVTRRGGRLSLLNTVEQTVIGASTWDQVAIMEYPDTTAFLDMLRDDDYAAGLVHRDAGLADTLVLVTRPLLAAR